MSTTSPLPPMTNAEDLWPAWSIEQPSMLARYLLPAEVTKRRHIPEPGAGATVSRAEAVYDAIRRTDGSPIRYAFEKDVLIDGRQIIRTPAEVLAFPGNGTCLDLAVVLAAALSAAHVPVGIVFLEDGSDGGQRHALVAVHLGTESPTWWPSRPDETIVWAQPPQGLDGDLAAKPHDAGDVILIDPNGLAVDLGTSPALGLQASFADAVAHGAHYLRSWRWRVGIVPSVNVEQFHPADAPASDPLAVPYGDPASAQGPLQFLRPAYQAVGFQNRTELTILEDLAENALASSTTQMAIVHGAGGSGKTRLALEVAEVLRRQGWYAGVLPKGAADVGWLAQVITPLCVVVDYAEGRLGKPDAPGDVRRLLGALRTRRPGLPTLIILTAREVSGGWVEELHNELLGQRQLVSETSVPLPNQHPAAVDLYARTVRTLNPAATLRPLPSAGPSWTTLDYLLWGWLTAKQGGDLPPTKSALYATALVHESDYWVAVYRSLRYDVDDAGKRVEVEPDRPRLRLAAAALTLVQAEPSGVDDILSTIPDFATKEVERDVLERTLTRCLGQDNHVTVRPDPIGDHLVLTHIATDANEATFAALTKPASAWAQALATLNRAGQNDHGRAVEVIRRLLAAHPDRWPVALDLALLQGGPISEAIETDVSSSTPQLPLHDLSEAIPFTAFITNPLGVHVDQARLARARQTTEPVDVVAALLVLQPHLWGGAAGCVMAASGAGLVSATPS